MKKKLLLGIGLIVAIAVATVGATYALFQYQTPTAVNVMTAGNVQIELVEQQRDGKGGLEPFEQGKALTPLVGSAQGEKDKFGMPVAKNYQDKIISVKNTGANEAYVRVLIAYPKVLKQGTLATDGTNNTDDALHSNLGNRVDFTGNSTYNTGDTWKTAWLWDYSSVAHEVIKIDGVEYLVECLIFKDKLASGAQTSAAIAGVYLDSRVDYENGAYVLEGKVLEGFNGVVTLPVIAQAVQADGFDNAISAFEAAFPYGNDNANLTEWFNTNGLVVAEPASGATRPAGYNPVEENTNTVDGITVIDNSDDKTNLRALYTGDGGKVTGDLAVTNSYLDGTYAMNVIGNDTGDLTVTNTALRGWVSYDGFKTATFTNVSFGRNTNPEYYNTIRPYSQITFVNCTFEGTDFWLDKVPAGEKVTFVNSTMNGELIDAKEDLTIVYGTAEVVIANS